MVQKSLIDMENMLSLFDVEPETDPAPDAAPFVHKGGSITADKLVFAYNDNQNILNDVSFKVANGQTVALVSWMNRSLRKKSLGGTLRKW